MSRLYAQLRAQGSPANKLFIENLEIPPSTANRWIAAARTKGYLD